MGNLSGSTHSTAAPVIKRNYLNKTNVLQYSKHRIVQNFILIWLDTYIDQSNKDCQYTISQLRQIVNSIELFTDSNTCFDFIEKVKDEQIFLIVSGMLGKTFLPVIHDYNRVDAIYVFCGTPSAHQWTNEWKKIHLVSNQIESICQLLVIDAAQCEQDLIPTSILPLNDSSNQGLDQVNQSFMYSQLIKEILLEMHYNEQALSVLVEFCRQTFCDNKKEVKIIDEFERDYHKYSPIWWYTRECFTYHMLNRSLRTFDIDIIAMMAFFMKGIHRQIQELYATRSTGMTLFTVYRGQGMLNNDFDKLRNNIGGLLSFNNFLSTSTDVDIAMEFARNRLAQGNKIGVLFEMIIDPGLTSTPFAFLSSVGCYGLKEKEILFSMHTVFRIIQINESEDGVWRVQLKLVSENDLQITRLTEQIRRTIGDGDAVERLGRLMITVGEFEKAEVLYDLLVNSTDAKDEKALARIFSQLGYIQDKQGNQSNAKSHYEKAVVMQERLRPSTDLDLAATYSNMGLLYTNLGDSSKALSYHQKALAIREKRLDQNHPDLATTYNNIGLVCDQRQEFTTALSYYQKTLAIYQKSLSPNHPYFATTYKNIGLAQISMGEQATGLNNLRKAMDIRKISLPANHPSIASICSTIAGQYRVMGDYSTALTFYQEALGIEEKAAPANNPTLPMTYHNISRTFNHLGQYPMAVKYAELAVQSARKSLSPNHRDTIMFQQNLEKLHTKLS